MQIKVHRGTHQIGGCITEIKSNKGTRIFIDVGENLPSLDVQGPEIEIEGLFSKPCDCHAVFVTHYHGDHIGLLNRVLEGIPVYIGKTAFEFLKVIDKYTRANTTKYSDVKTFVAEDKILIEDITVIPYRVDHSAYDAYMFLIECDGKRILHTGDFRTHGWTGNGILKLAEKLIRNVDIIITEGTMVSRMNENVMKESELKLNAKNFLKDNDIFVLCSSTNIDTIASFYHATQENKKLFVCDSYQREILDIIKDDENPNKSVLYNLTKAKVYGRGREEDTINKMKAMGFCCLVRANGYDAFPDLMKKFPNAKLIYSMFDGYLDETKDYRNEDYIKMVKEFNGLTRNWHTSGHATFDAIKSLCNALKPKHIIPIHTEKPEMFKNFSDYEIVLLQDKEIFELK